MKTSMMRILVVLLLALSFVFSPFASVVQADGSPTFDIVAVKLGESVTIRTHNFPANQLFTVRMGKYGTQAVNGTVVDSTNSGAGGSFDVTYKIPADLKAETKIAIRLESSGGYYSYNWFTNQSGNPSSPTATPAPTTSGGSTSGKARLTIVSVEKNVSVKLRAENLPANQTFTIRIGTYYNFFKDYAVVGSFGSGSGGTLEWTSNLPDVVKGVELVSVRIDSSGLYAYNAFKNVTGGSSGSSGTGVTPVPVSGACTVVSVKPSGSVSTREDFDAVWEVKNTSGKTWDSSAVDYKYISGVSMHEKAVYDLQSSVNNGDTFKFIVDMKAPESKGSFTTSWAVVQGGTTLCNLKVTINVK